MRQFFKYLIGFYYRPVRAMRELAADRNALWYGLAALLLISILYSFTSAALYFSPNECCWTEPLIKVAEEDYWLVQIIWEIPLMFALAIIPAALVEFLTHNMRPESDFKILFAGMGFLIIVVQLLTMWLPETLMAFAGRNFLPPLVNTLRVNIFVPWALLLLAIMVHEIKNAGWLRSVLVSVFAFLPSAILPFIFVR